MPKVAARDTVVIPVVDFLLDGQRAGRPTSTTGSLQTVNTLSDVLNELIALVRAPPCNIHGQRHVTLKGDKLQELQIVPLTSTRDSHALQPIHSPPCQLGFPTHGFITGGI